MGSAIVSKNYATFPWKYKDLSLGKGLLPYLGMVGRFCGDDPRFCDCRSDLVLLYSVTRSDWPPLSAEKISLGLSHLIPEIRGHKVPFCINFCPNFRSNWPLFSLVLDLIDPSFLQNFRSDWVHCFIICRTSLPNIWWSTPTPQAFHS